MTRTPGPWVKKRSMMRIVRAPITSDKVALDDVDEVGFWQIAKKNDNRSVIAYLSSGKDGPSKWANPAPKAHIVRQEDNADLILIAVNSHDELLSASKALLSVLALNDMMAMFADEVNALNAAIEKAGDKVDLER